jgi:hypothetical protein
MKTDDVLEINCPKCGDVHRYLLEIKRSIVLENSMIKLPSTPIKKSYKRLFSCPEKDADFEATILLTETPHNKIQSVKVKGIAKEDNYDSN